MAFTSGDIQRYRSQQIMAYWLSGVVSTGLCRKKQIDALLGSLEDQQELIKIICQNMRLSAAEINAESSFRRV